MISSAPQPSVAATPALDMAKLSPLYTSPNREQVRQFLESRPSALTLLQDAPAHVESVFGAGTLLRLEVRSDPEYPQRRELWAFILAGMQTPEKVMEAERNLRRLHDEWLIQLPRALSGSVYFDVEFR